MSETYRRVADLTPGDCTPWYEVKATPEREGQGYRVLVHHDPPADFTDYVRGDANELVPLIERQA